jgi:hypothetical protein
MTSFLANINRPHPNSKVFFGSLTIIPNKGEEPIYMEDLPSEVPTEVLSIEIHTNKSRKFAGSNRRRQIHPISDKESIQFEHVPVACCVVS